MAAMEIARAGMNKAVTSGHDRVEAILTSDGSGSNGSESDGSSSEQPQLTQPQLTQKAIVALGPLLPRFAQTMELGAPLKVALAKAVEADEPAGKRLARAKMLHNVLSAKYPNVKLDDAAKMTAEWVHGVLDASYPAESAVVDGKFSDSDSATTIAGDSATTTTTDSATATTMDSATATAIATAPATASTTRVGGSAITNYCWRRRLNQRPERC